MAQKIDQAQFAEGLITANTDQLTEVANRHTLPIKWVTQCLAELLEIEKAERERNTAQAVEDFAKGRETLITIKEGIKLNHANTSDAPRIDVLDNFIHALETNEEDIQLALEEININDVKSSLQAVEAREKRIQADRTDTKNQKDQLLKDVQAKSREAIAKDAQKFAAAAQAIEDQNTNEIWNTMDNVALVRSIVNEFMIMLNRLRRIDNVPEDINALLEQNNLKPIDARIATILNYRLKEAKHQRQSGTEGQIGQKIHRNKMQEIAQAEEWAETQTDMLNKLIEAIELKAVLEANADTITNHVDIHKDGSQYGWLIPSLSLASHVDLEEEYAEIIKAGEQTEEAEKQVQATNKLIQTALEALEAKKAQLEQGAQIIQEGEEAISEIRTKLEKEFGAKLAEQQQETERLKEAEAGAEARFKTTNMLLATREAERDQALAKIDELQDQLTNLPDSVRAAIAGARKRTFALLGAAFLAVGGAAFLGGRASTPQPAVTQQDFENLRSQLTDEKSTTTTQKAQITKLKEEKTEFEAQIKDLEATITTLKAQLAEQPNNTDAQDKLRKCEYKLGQYRQYQDVVNRAAQAEGKTPPR